MKRYTSLIVLFILLLSFAVSYGSPAKKIQRNLMHLPRLTIDQEDRELVSIVEVEGKEYFVDPNYTNVSWSQAQEYCQLFNMTVGETITANQHQQVWLSIPLFYNYWLGGTDTSSESSWYWITDSITFNYSRWGFGEPAISESKNCLFLIEDLQNWWTIDCDNQQDEIEEIYVLCQKLSI